MVSTSVMLWGSAGFAAASWIVGLGGLGAVTSDCYDSVNFGGVECARGLQYEWWGLWFEFFLLLATLYLAARDRIAVNQSLIHTFLGMATTVLMWSARNLMMRGSFSSGFVVRKAAQDAAAAGFVCMCLFNFLLIIAVGCISTGQTLNLPVSLGAPGASPKGAPQHGSSSSSDCHASPYEKFTDAVALSASVPNSAPVAMGTSPFKNHAAAAHASYAV